MVEAPVAERTRRIALLLIIGIVASPLLLPMPAHATAGVIKEFRVPTPGSHPGGIVIGPDGAVWFTEIATNAIGRLQAGTITTFPLPHWGQPTSIVSGPDGALWFTEYSGDRIGRISTSGQITEFPVPRCGECAEVGPWDISVGPDNAMWFTELDANRIGRITSAGVITQFDLPGRVGDPIAITSGPDEALWFTDDFGIGRITTDGIVTQEWGGASYPTAITTGPDGNLWATEGSQDLVARLDPSSGKAKEFRIALNCFPQDIASGSGALWFTCYNVDEVGRVTTGGRVTGFPVPNHFNGNYPDTLEGIVAGPHGVMWFTEEAANRIGRISTS